MTQIYSNTSEELKKALEHLENLDVWDMAVTFLKACAESPTLYHALELNPRTGTYHVTSEASWACSADEYFEEHGALSRVSVLSASASNYYPSPDGEFEWKEDEDGSYVFDGSWDNSDWASADNLADILKTFAADADEEDFEDAEDAEDAIKKLNLVRFSVDRTDPIDGWDTENAEREIRESIAGIQEEIEAELEEIEEEEESE